jgi:hypothetical protein
MVARIKPIGDGIAEIQLSRGLAALINDGDVEIVSRLSWYPSTNKQSTTTYVRGRLDKRSHPSAIHLHRLLLCFPLFHVDHINGNGLDNRRCNLRAASPQQNACNIPLRQNKTSIYRGVYLAGARWAACIRVNRKLINLGQYESEEEAAIAYDTASLKLHGKFGNPNFAAIYDAIDSKLSGVAS